MSRRPKNEVVAVAEPATLFECNMLSKDNVISFSDNIVIDTGASATRGAQQQHDSAAGGMNKQQLVARAIENMRKEREEQEWNP